MVSSGCISSSCTSSNCGCTATAMVSGVSCSALEGGWGGATVSFEWPLGIPSEMYKWSLRFARNTLTDTTGVSSDIASYRARVTLIKVPRGNELFAGFSAGAVRVFTEKHFTGSKALRSVGFSPFFARRVRVEVRYRSALSSNLNANFRSFWIHFTVTPVVWVRSFIPVLLNSNSGSQSPVLQ